MALSFLAALLFIYIFMPDLWLYIMSIDESLDSHESGLALVASRVSFLFYFIPLPQSYKILGNPFRESGPPANMAKLILLRHKVGQSNHFLPSVISSLNPDSNYKQKAALCLPFTTGSTKLSHPLAFEPKVLLDALWKTLWRKATSLTPPLRLHS